MKGLELSRLFWSKVGFPSFSRIFPDRLSDIVVGMVGPGAECYGFDDTYSQDHDWGPGFCVWMNDAEDLAFKVQLQAWYDSLPKIFEGFARSNVLEGEDHRVGVDSVFHFYERYTGLNHIPCSEREWPYLSTSSLVLCSMIHKERLLHGGKHCLRFILNLFGKGCLPSIADLHRKAGNTIFIVVCCERMLIQQPIARLNTVLTAFQLSICSISDMNPSTSGVIEVSTIFPYLANRACL
jgi:hypothetical protein